MLGRLRGELWLVKGALNSGLQLLAFVYAHSEAGVVACGNDSSILGPDSFVLKIHRPSLH